MKKTRSRLLLTLAAATCVALPTLATRAHASDPFIGEILIFAGNFPPRGYAECDGQLLSVSSNDALFSLLGTTYGGDGRTTFGLPDLRGRMAVHEGSGPGLAPRNLGAKWGSENTTLSVANLPSHSHGATVAAVSGAGTTDSPNGAALAVSALNRMYLDTAPDSTMKDGTVVVAPTGGSQSFSVLDPTQAVTYCIALTGVYPSRN